MVVLSFLLSALVVRSAPAPQQAGPDVIATAPRAPAGVLRVPVLVLKLVALAVFLVTILAGWLGEQDPYRNIAPVLVWVIWWVGFVYLSALAGDIWRLINPWRSLFDVTQGLLTGPGGAGLTLGWRYPAWLGVWPACLLLLAFAWIELVYPQSAVPARIACLAVAYSVITLGGMVAFGRDVWLDRGEVFTIVFGLFARVAPVELRDGRLQLRAFGAGLAHAPPASPSVTALVLLLLAVVLYDGLLAAPAWSEWQDWLQQRGPFFDPMTVRTLGLVAAWLLFGAAYAAVCGLMSAVDGGRSARDLAGRFAMTLVPIALGYHVAHYAVFLLVQGQYVIPLLSDPFGFGWDLFGTANHRVDIGIVGARFGWYVALAGIVLGHAAAVHLGHVRAMQAFPARGAALRSQLPMTALMVVYTMTGLSIIAEPIVERERPAAPAAVAGDPISVPADALAPDPASGLLQPAGADRVARQRLTYRVLGSAFHDGSRTEAGDLIYAYAFAQRWGVRHGDGDARYDPVVEAATALLRRGLVAVRIAGADAASRSFQIGDVRFEREVFSIEVYLSERVLDPDRHAAAAAPWSTLPWHLMALMEEGVARGWAAFSREESARRGVPWLDLVRDRDLVGRLAALLPQFERDGHRPAVLQALVSADQARRRWSALAAFHRERGHLLVTNGPYRLRSWDGGTARLEAFRDLSYPLGVGSYDAYAIPRRGFVTGVARSGERLTISADVEVVQKFQRSHRLVRMPLRTLAPEVRRRLAPDCRYTVVDERQRVVAAGIVPLGEGPDFVLDLRLSTGRYAVLAAVAVAGNVMNAEIRRIPLVVGVESQ